MPDDPTLFDECHLHWTLAPTSDDANTDTLDADRLHAELNAPAVKSAVEHAVREVCGKCPCSARSPSPSPSNGGRPRCSPSTAVT